MGKNQSPAERFAAQLNKFADNNPRYRRGEVDSIKIGTAECLQPPSLGRPLEYEVEHIFEARRFMQKDESTGDLEVWSNFSGSTTLTGPFEDIPIWIARQIPSGPEYLQRRFAQARREVAYWYEVDGSDPSAIDIGTTLQYLDLNDDPLFMVSDEAWDPADTTGTPEEEDRDPSDPVTPNYHYQRRIHESLGRATDLDRLIYDDLVTTSLRDELIDDYERSNIEIASMCFQAMRRTLRQQAGV